jgi:inner membrane protein involved in colicin E2 resistance
MAKVISELNRPALILGSLLLSAVLTVVMVVTRKIDWYKQSAERIKDSVSPPPASPAQGFSLRS